MKNLGKTILGAIILALLAIGLNVSAQTVKQPKFLLINGIKEDAAYVMQSGDPADILSGKTISFSFETVKADKEKAENALKKIKELLDGGTPDTEPIEVAGEKLTVGRLSELLLARHLDLSKVLVAREFFQAGSGTKAFVDDIASGKMTDSDAYGDPLTAAKIHSERLLKAVTEAQKLGFPEDFTADIHGTKYTIPELKEMALYVLTNSKIQKEAIVAARNAKDVPFLNVLIGDKARIFKQEFGGLGGEWLCLGSGGAALTTPAAMKSATVWYTYGNNRGIVDTWHVTGYKFQGDKLVGTTSKSGFGLKPPAAAFR